MVRMTLIAAVAVTCAVAAACSSDDGNAQTPGAQTAPAAQQRFVSPTVGGYRFVREPLAVAVRTGEGPSGELAGFDLWFRLNRALPRRSTVRLEGDTGFPAAMRVGRRAKHCYWQPIDGGPPDDAKAGDPVTVRIDLAGVSKPLEVGVPLRDRLPRIVDDSGLGVKEAPYTLKLGCAGPNVERWARRKPR